MKHDWGCELEWRKGRKCRHGASAPGVGGGFLVVNEKRVRVLRLVGARPGLGVRDVGRRLGLSSGVASYHVGELVRHGLVSVARFGGRSLVFPYPVAPGGLELALRVVLEDAHLFCLYEWVRVNGPVAQGLVVDHFPEPRATVQGRLQRLCRAGLLRVEVKGRSRLYSVVPV